MKTFILIVMATFSCLSFLLNPLIVNSQPVNDSTANFFTITAYYDHFYDSLVQLRGAENMQGTGYKDYLRWKWFYNYRHGIHGELKEIMEAITDYHLSEPTNSNNEESSWKFIGPTGFPLNHGLEPSMNTGKGMILSLWSKNSNFSHMYAGSHHSGFWRTTDNGNNWFPMTENYPEIVGVNSIAVDPRDSNVIIITSNSSLGEQYSKYSAGLYKSLDGGLSWHKLNPGINYPTSNKSERVRKVMIDEINPEYIYFISYRDVFRSENLGEDWTLVFHKEYDPYSSENQLPNVSNNHTGLWDFKYTPWENDNIAYLAGSEIFRIDNPTGSFDTINISNEVFLAGLLPGVETIAGHPYRCEISMSPYHENVVWFCYVADYNRIQGTNKYIRIVRLDENGYHILYDAVDNLGEFGDNKLEFIVSPSCSDVFYLGGMNLYKIIDRPDPEDDIFYNLKNGKYPEETWLHVDIRDMQVFGDNEVPDTLFTANDAGISYGMPMADDLDPCYGTEYWQWIHPCKSVKNGLNVTELYHIGICDSKEGLLAGGCQDLSNMMCDQNKWINFGDGDGTELLWDPNNINIVYFSEMVTGTIYRSENKGVNPFFIKTFPKNNLIMPMDIDYDIYDEDTVTNLFVGGDALFKLTGVNNFDDPVVSEEIKDFSPQVITDLEVSKTSTPGLRRYYVSTNKSYYENNNPPNPELYTDCIFISTDNGNTFYDISDSLIGCLNGFISDIEVSHLTFSKIWVAFAGYSVGSTQQKKLFRSEDSGETWQDFSNGLPPGMPVYKIKYVTVNDHHFLLAATDIGIFKSGIQNADWQPINYNLPKSIVTDIEVNPSYNVVYASTFGRGLWKTSLLCNYVAEPETIVESKVWVNNHILERTQVIPGGVTLTIRNCIIYFPSEAKIVVERGGKLILDNCTLTSACTDLWWGVEVQGNSRREQTGQYQGMIVLENGAIIENARKAIFCGKNIENDYPDWNYTGGIVDATDSKFLNNRYGVQFWTYHDNNRNYLASFSRCTFQTNELLADGSSPEYFMTLVQVNGIVIEGCLFEFSNEEESDYRKHGNGIFSLDAGYTITDFENLKMTGFKNLFYGILAMKVFADPNLIIHDSYFTSNITGLFARGLQNLSLYSNDFNVYIDKLPLGTEVYGGVYLDNCSGYLIEKNNFTGTPSSFGWNDIGLAINNSGEAFNEIYKNTFNDLYIGTLAQNINRNEKNPDYGLKLNCNVYNNNEFDIAVTGPDGCEKVCGISKVQGTPDIPAGNCFSQTGIQKFGDFNNEMAFITYIQHKKDDLHPPNRWLPVYFTENTIDTVYGWVSWNYNSCPSRNNENKDKTFNQDLYISSTTTIDSISTLLAQLIDGGSTEALDLEITFAQPDEVLELRDELLNDSPYLSDTILVKTAEKEDVLPPVIVKEIMVANPQSAKSEKVLGALESRDNPMPEYMMTEIISGRDSLAHKELLEAELSYLGLQKENAFNRLISIFREDSISTRMDSIINLLQIHNTLSASYRLMLTYLEMNDTGLAINKLNNIPQQFEMTYSQEFIHEHWIELVMTMLELKADSLMLPDLDSVQIEKMNELAQFEDLPGCIARNTLYYLGVTEVEPHYLLPNDQFKSLSARVNMQQDFISRAVTDFKLYPNPAKNFIIAEYNIDENSDEGILSIFNSSGRLQYIKSLDQNKHDYIIDTKNWPGGLYFYNFISEDNIKETGKFIIIR